MKSFLIFLAVTLFLSCCLILSCGNGWSPIQSSERRFTSVWYEEMGNSTKYAVITDSVTGCQYLNWNSGTAAMPHTCTVDKK